MISGCRNNRVEAPSGSVTQCGAIALIYLLSLNPKVIESKVVFSATVCPLKSSKSRISSFSPKRIVLVAVFEILWTSSSSSSVVQNVVLKRGPYLRGPSGLPPRF